MAKNLPATGDLCSIPGMGRSPGGRNGNPLLYSCLGNPRDRRRVWQAIVRGVAKSRSDWATKHSTARLLNAHLFCGGMNEAWESFLALCLPGFKIFFRGNLLREIWERNHFCNTKRSFCFIPVCSWWESKLLRSFQIF